MPRSPRGRLLLRSRTEEQAASVRDYADKLKALSPISSPLAPKKLTKKLLKTVKKGTHRLPFARSLQTKPTGAFSRQGQATQAWREGSRQGAQERRERVCVVGSFLGLPVLPMAEMLRPVDWW